MNHLELAVLVVSLFLVIKNGFAQIDEGLFVNESGGIDMVVAAIAFFIGIIFLILFILWLITLFKILTAKNSGKWKIAWFLVVFFLSGIAFIGLIAYLLIGKKTRIAPQKKPKETGSGSGHAFARKESLSVQKNELISKEFKSESRDYTPPTEPPKTGSEPKKYVPSLNGLKSKTNGLKEEKTVQEPVSTSVEEKPKEVPKSFSEPEPQSKPVSVVAEPPLLGDLSSEEKEQVNQLVGILVSEKESYSVDQVQKVIFEKGYSSKVAKEVIKKLYS